MIEVSNNSIDSDILNINIFVFLGTSLISFLFLCLPFICFLLVLRYLTPSSYPHTMSSFLYFISPSFITSILPLLIPFFLLPSHHVQVLNTCGKLICILCNQTISATKKSLQKHQLTKRHTLLHTDVVTGVSVCVCLCVSVLVCVCVCVWMSV